MSLQGIKTYLAAAVIGIMTAANYLGWIDQSLYQTLVGLLGAAGLAALRAGVAKAGE